MRCGGAVHASVGYCAASELEVQGRCRVDARRSAGCGGAPRGVASFCCEGRSLRRGQHGAAAEVIAARPARRSCQASGRTALEWESEQAAPRSPQVAERAWRMYTRRRP